MTMSNPQTVQAVVSEMRDIAASEALSADSKWVLFYRAQLLAWADTLVSLTAAGEQESEAGLQEERRQFNERLAHLEAAVARLTEELQDWRTWGIIEIAIRNPNVASYMDHWEKRAISAEATLATVGALVEQWRIQAAHTDTFHATMGTGWKACADELATALGAPVAPSGTALE